MNLPRLLAALIFGTALTFTAAVAKDVTAAQVNGTWESKHNTFKVWALGGGKLQVAFDGTFEYKTADGLMANTGEGSGIATIEGDTAIFRPAGFEEASWSSAETAVRRAWRARKNRLWIAGRVWFV